MTIVTIEELAEKDKRQGLVCEVYMCDNSNDRRIN